MNNEELLKLAESSYSECSELDFKESFNPSDRREWCEIIKDIVAMANSGGGCILFGVDDSGQRSPWDPEPLFTLDLAVITDNVARYTGRQFGQFTRARISRNGDDLPALFVHGSRMPLLFEKPGAYPTQGGKQSSAFSQGTLYFRHGAKSETATAEDIEILIHKLLDHERRELLSNITTVIEAPRGYVVRALPPDVRASTDAAATPIRLVDDLDAPTYRLVNPNETHRLTLKDLITYINTQLERIAINTYDVQCVRKLYKINKNPAYFYSPLKGSPQYTRILADWLVAECRKDPQFFRRTRDQARLLLSATH